MKILELGKAEQKKFVCHCCKCEFVAALEDNEWWGDQVLYCPTCAREIPWDGGEPYEETALPQTQENIQKLAKITEEFLNDNVRISYSEMDLVRFAKHLIANGVTFKEDP